MKFIILAISLSLSIALQAQTMNTEEVVQSNLDAYNANDIDTFMSYFSQDVVMVNFESSEQTAQGIEEVRAIYEPYFKASPDLHSKILKRIVFGNKVIDHESITGRYGSNEVLELVLIYEVEDQKISKVTVIRK